MKKFLFILGVFGMHSPAFAEESYLCSPFSYSNPPILVDMDTTQPDKITIKAKSNQTGADFDIVIQTYCATGSATSIDTDGRTNGPLTYDNIGSTAQCFYQMTEPVLSQYVRAPRSFNTTMACLKGCSAAFPGAFAGDNSIARGIFDSIISW